jgi:hypothetical protein
MELDDATGGEGAKVTMVSYPMVEWLFNGWGVASAALQKALSGFFSL